MGLNDPFHLFSHHRLCSKGSMKEENILLDLPCNVVRIHPSRGNIKDIELVTDDSVDTGVQRKSS